MTTEDVLSALVEECHDAPVGLWGIINAVRYDLGARGPEDVRATTLRLVRGLLKHPGMCVGHPTPNGRDFIAWGLSADQVVSRIDEEWKALGRDPNIGDVA